MLLSFVIVLACDRKTAIEHPNASSFENNVLVWNIDGKISFIFGNTGIYLKIQEVFPFISSKSLGFVIFRVG